MKSDHLFAAYCGRLSDFIDRSSAVPTEKKDRAGREAEFDALALELFGLQFSHNSSYQKLCRARGLGPDQIKTWAQIPAAPAVAFKEWEMTSLAPEQRTAVFHSSGTTEQRPSRHFHCAASLVMYEKSLKAWYRSRLFGGADRAIPHLFLTPSATDAPNSSLVHMFGTVRQAFGTPESAFAGRTGMDGAWVLDMESAFQILKHAAAAGLPIVVLGTAFSYVHLLDECAARGERFRLPAGSRVLETGGYKGRSRTVPKVELHALIAERFGITHSQIICEYGMSELSSQAYDAEVSGPAGPRRFGFPPWARMQVISPETGRAVKPGETGLIRICDLANVFSVMSIQTEDLGVMHEEGFELVGRATAAESRGCSLMAS